MIRHLIVLLFPAVFLGFGASLQAADIVFDNTTLSNSAAISNANLSAIWGDFVRLTRTGRLSELTFAIYNSGSSSGALTSATVTLNFYDYTGGIIGSSFGGFSANWTGTLSQGFYSLFTVTSLDSLNIDLNSTDIFISQQLSNVVGSSRMGVVVTYSTSTTAGTNLTNGFYQSIGGATNNNAVVSGQTVSNLFYKVSLASVPEPSTYVMSILAMTVCFAMRHRVRRCQAA